MDFHARNKEICRRVKAGDSYGSIGRDLALSYQRIEQIAKANGIRSQHMFERPLSFDLRAAHRLAKKGRPFNEIALVVGAKTGNVVSGALQRHGLYTPSPAPARWTAAETRLLRRVYHRDSASQIAERLGRNKNEIIGKANRLGLCRPTFCPQRYVDRANASPDARSA